MKKLKLMIKGMHCSSCSTNIQKSVGKISGVKSVSVSLMTHKGIVECEDKVNDSDVKKAVERAGYKVVSLEKQ
jgi:P-type Cu+ transporter